MHTNSRPSSKDTLTTSNKRFLTKRLIFSVLSVTIVGFIIGINSCRKTISDIEVKKQIALNVDNEVNRAHREKIKEEEAKLIALKTELDASKKRAEQAEKELSKKNAELPVMLTPPPSAAKTQRMVEREQKLRAPDRSDFNIIFSQLSKEEFEALKEKLRKFINKQETEGVEIERFGKVFITWKIDNSSFMRTVGRTVIATATITNITGENGIPENNIGRKFIFFVRDIDEDPLYIRLHNDKIEFRSLFAYFRPENRDGTLVPVIYTILTPVLNKKILDDELMIIKNFLKNENLEVVIHYGLLQIDAVPENDRDHRNFGLYLLIPAHD